MADQLRYLADGSGCGVSLTQCTLGDIEPGQEFGFDILVQMADDAQSGQVAASSSTVKTDTDGVKVDDTESNAAVVVDQGNGVEGSEVFWLSRITGGLPPPRPKGTRIGVCYGKPAQVTLSPATYHFELAKLPSGRPPCHEWPGLDTCAR